MVGQASLDSDCWTKGDGSDGRGGKGWMGRWEEGKCFLCAYNTIPLVVAGVFLEVID